MNSPLRQLHPEKLDLERRRPIDLLVDEIHLDRRSMRGVDALERRKRNRKNKSKRGNGSSIYGAATTVLSTKSPQTTERRNEFNWGV